jgi:hypothetical protein
MERPRPICPRCGSVEVTVLKLWGQCTNCKRSARRAVFFAYPMGTGEQRCSTDNHERRLRFLDGH